VGVQSLDEIQVEKAQGLWRAGDLYGATQAGTGDWSAWGLPAAFL